MLLRVDFAPEMLRRQRPGGPLQLLRLQDLHLLRCAVLRELFNSHAHRAHETRRTQLHCGIQERDGRLQDEALVHHRCGACRFS